MIIQKFEEQVKLHSEKPAVITEKTQLTYNQLNTHATEVAQTILNHKSHANSTISPDSKQVVGLLFEHSADMIIGVLGTLKADKIYVPLDINYPTNRLIYMLQNSGIYLLLTNTANLNQAKQLIEKSENIIEIINIETLKNTNIAIEIQRKISGRKPAYILYTSGSTGKPKGVLQNHENVCYYIQNWTERFSITKDDRMTLFSAFSHDGAGQDMFGALHNGATLYPYNILNRSNIAELAQWLADEKITIWHSVPTLYRYFVDTLAQREKDFQQFLNLRLILLGGEQIREHDIDLFRQYFPNSKFANVYGQTESSVNSIWMISPHDKFNKMLIGEPLNKTELLIVDDEGTIIEDVGIGEIVVACPHIALGYWKDEENSKKMFKQAPEIGPIYRTGDLGRLLIDGSIEIMGRKDNQVKIRGFRIETGEIETSLLNHNSIKEAVVVIRNDSQENAHLYAYYVLQPGVLNQETTELTVPEIRKHLSTQLPEYMVPSYFIRLEQMPLTPNGKIDRKQLPEPEHSRPQLGITFVEPRTMIEKKISTIWQEVLQLEKVGMDDNFFDLGGTSFDILKISTKLYEVFKKEIPVVTIFQYPTLRTFSEYLEKEENGQKQGKQKIKRRTPTSITSPSIAIIGMAGRFPGAKNIDEFWENIKNGLETISFFSHQELEQNGVESQSLQDSNYVNAFGVLSEVEYFDAAFFNYSPAEAEMMDPQLRILHECSWEAIENAGYQPGNYDGLIGLYAGNAPNPFWTALTFMNKKNSLDAAFLNNNYSTKVSYKLNLKGPSVIVQTACSTSLVAIHFACQGLTLGECDMAVAGAVSINLPDRQGYVYREGMILSPDGHCRAFDEKAGGTIFGNGVGMVVLKRLEDAVNNRDTIVAVIKGSAINNDGNRKVGLTAPSVEGQAEVIAAAQETAGIEPESISYIETHGTGTPLGDPVEIEALKLAFNTDRKGYCSIGSVKSNIGHLNAASGVAGLIKVILSLKYKLLPPSINYAKPNPKIDFTNSPFQVNRQLRDWRREAPGKPLRAAVSSFGIGGTNAHILLEESQYNIETQENKNQFQESSLPSHQLILLSAKTQAALKKTTEKLIDHLRKNQKQCLADVAYTLQIGRKPFKYRSMTVCSTREELFDRLSIKTEITDKNSDIQLAFNSIVVEANPSIIFMFSGQGAQYINMGLELYNSEPFFREQLEHCFKILTPLMGSNFKDFLYPSETSKIPEKTTKPIDINQTEITQPVIFVIEYALSKLLLHWGITPSAMIGHSIGEYVAACLSEVFSLEDALKLIVLRAKLMQQMPEGAMLSIPLSEEEIKPYLHDGLSLAAANSTSHCVISGSKPAITELIEQLKNQGYNSRILHTSHAFHSFMMEPILEEYEQNIQKIQLSPPKMPYISNVTGKWISKEEAMNPKYWVHHLISTVRYSDGLTELLTERPSIFVEVGPGRSLSTFVRQHQLKQSHHKIYNLLRHPDEKIPDTLFLINQIGHLWLNGVTIDWKTFHDQEKRYRVPLPTYPFEEKRYWLQGDPSRINFQQTLFSPHLEQMKASQKDWSYAPKWTHSPLTVDSPSTSPHNANWLILNNNTTLANTIVRNIKETHKDETITVVNSGDKSGISGNESQKIINPHNKDQYELLFEELHKNGNFPNKIIHLWSLSKKQSKIDYDTELQDTGYYSLLHLAYCIGKYNSELEQNNHNVEIIIVSNNLHTVTEDDDPEIQKATINGAVQVITREYPTINCRTIDIDIINPGIENQDEDNNIRMLLADIDDNLQKPHEEMHIAYRDHKRWVKTFNKISLDSEVSNIPLIKEGGVYLITGGLGGIGFVLAKELAKNFKARLVLTGRSPFPAPRDWENWLKTHPSTNEISAKIKKIREMEAEGAKIEVFSTDITNQTKMADVIAYTEKNIGPINGIIHSAGIADGALIQRRNQEMSEKVFAPKIKGTLVLENLFKEKELDFMILCSSISSLLAPIGQVAYCAANAFLDTYAWYKSTKNRTCTISINWDNWQEVGMAVKAVESLQPFSAEQKNLDHPLFHHKEIQDVNQETFISYLNINDQWVLDEHRILGQSTLPGTAYIEMARFTLQSYAPNDTLEIKEIYFLKPLIVTENETKEVHTQLINNNGEFTFSIKSKRTGSENQWEEHAKGKAIVNNSVNSTQYQLHEIELQCNQDKLLFNAKDYTGNRGAMKFGPRWNNLKKVNIGENQGLAYIELPGDFRKDIEYYKFHPALMDVATSFLHVTQKNKNTGQAYLPFYYKSIRFNSPIQEKVYCCSQEINNGENNSNQEIIRYTISITDENGKPLVEIEEFSLKKIAMSLQKEKNNGLIPFHTSKKETSLEKIKVGILPQEGVEIFKKVLRNQSTPQVIISTTDLFSRLQQPWEEIKPQIAGEDSIKSTTSIKHTRPELNTQYIPPQSETEKRLATLWENLLGIQQIGIYDDFFELGGDSLKAVNFSAHIQKEFNSEVPISEFFNRPNIKKLAQFISNNTGTTRFQTIHSVEKKEYYPLSAAQHRLYILHSLEQESLAYNLTNVKLLNMNLEMGHLQLAYEKMLRRHYSFRTTFEILDENPIQKVNDENRVNHSIVFYDNSKKIETEQNLIQSFVKPFDLNTAPLIRTLVIKMSDSKYILMTDMHHIISDATSFQIFFTELTSYYEEKNLPPLRIQYTDYTEWQKKHLGPSLHKQEKYWLNILSGEIPVINFPLDSPRPNIQNFEGKMQTFFIDTKETEAIKNLVKKEEATLFMVLSALFNIFIKILSSQDDVIIGTPVAGRTHSETEEIIGMFTNTLVLRNQIHPNMNFTSFLSELKQKTLKAFENQDYPFETLVEKVAVARDLSRNPLFDFMFLLRNESGVIRNKNERGKELEDKGKEIELKPYRYNKIASQFDLSFICFEKNQRIFIDIEYSSILFRDASIEKFIRYFHAITTAVLENPKIKLRKLSILSEEEKDHLLFTLNKTDLFYPTKSLHGMIEEQVKLVPDKVAVVGMELTSTTGSASDICEHQCNVTYKELNQITDRVAHELQIMGILPDLIVGLMISRSISMITALLGILKTGGAYLPLDPEYPEQRIKYILEKSNPHLVIIGREFKSKIVNTDYKGKTYEFPVINSQYSQTKNTYKNKLTVIFPSHTLSHHLAYVIYTSGSTGNPKGVMIQHSNIANFIAAMNAQIVFSPGKRILALTTISFDIFALETWVPLSRGMQVSIATAEQQIDSTLLSEVILVQGIDMLQFTPSRLKLVLNSNDEPICLKQITELIIGGEAFPAHLLDHLKTVYSGKIYNVYGPTESTVWSTLKDLTHADRVTIGNPIANTKIFIVNKYNNLQPPGIPGELLVGGDGVAVGYLNNVELTAEKFIISTNRSDFLYPNLFPSNTPIRTKLYKTGDLARWASDNEIEFLGRIDHQVKVRGYRIETEEIESYLLTDNRIKEVVVTDRIDNTGETYLCAYFVTKEVYGITTEELKENLANVLPDYMIPAFFINLEKLPETPNGKIDRNALPEPEIAGGKEITAPTTYVEEVIASIWSDILSLDKKKISIYGNFFQLGGHSLKATLLLSRIHKEFNVKIPLKEVFKTPNIKGIVNYISSLKTEKYQLIKTVEKREWYQLSTAQKRLYILQQIDKENVGYNVTHALNLEGKINKEQLEEIFQLIIVRHEILRTSFQMVRVQPVQRVLENVKFNIKWLNEEIIMPQNSDNPKQLSEGLENNIESGTQSPDLELFIKKFIQPFDLTCAPLLRVGLIYIRENNYVLVVDMHHLVSDGTSWQTLVKELFSFYSNQILSPLRLQYKDFACWQNSPEQLDLLKNQEIYWLKELSGEIPVLDLPLDFQRPSLQDFSGAELEFSITSKETEQLKAIAQSANSTLYMILLSIFSILLSKLSGQEDVIVGTPVAARRHSDLESIMGVFINTLIMRNHPTKNKKFNDFLEEVRINSVTAFDNQEYPFEELVDKASVKRDLSRNPIFDVMLILHNELDNLKAFQIRDTQLKVKPFKFNRQSTQFDLTLVGWESPHQLRFTLEYCTKLFKEKTLKRFIDYFKRICSLITENPQIKIADIDIIPKSERNRLLYEFNATQIEIPTKTLHGTIENQLDKTNDVIAVTGLIPQSGNLIKMTEIEIENKSYNPVYSLTYKELNNSSQKLAHYLQLKGATPGIIIGLLMERSPLMVTTLLAILKTGSAYLPLDPEYPEIRIKYIIEKSNARLLLTQTDVLRNKEEFNLQGEIIDIFNTEIQDHLQSEKEYKSKSYGKYIDPAYVIYTSGSTGNPKGVIISHQNAINFITGMKSKIEFLHYKSILALTTISFDIFFLETLLPLSCGMKIVIAAEIHQKDPAILETIIINSKINILQLTPSRLQLLLDFSKNPLIFKYISDLLVGGEAFVPHLLNRLKENYKGKIFNMYGPTETSIWSMVKEITHTPPDHLTIGTPIANTKILIVNEEMELQPVGVAGELLIGGTGVALGYLNNIELTAEKFLNAQNLPMNNKPLRLKETLYKTGDLARWLDNGEVEFLGRLDYQVKIRGFRVELEEIEEYLFKLEIIKEAVVVLKKGKNGEQSLCAYVIPNNTLTEHTIDPAELRQYLATKLPHYMIPTYILPIEKMPLTPNGKIDRNALPEPMISLIKRGNTGTFIEPSNNNEKIIAQIWKEILLLEEIGIHDNFFDLGGNSMKVIQLSWKMKEAFNIEIPVAKLFRNLTIDFLSQYINQEETKSKKREKEKATLDRDRDTLKNTLSKLLD